MCNKKDLGSVMFIESDYKDMSEMENDMNKYAERDMTEVKTVNQIVHPKHGLIVTIFYT